MKIRKYFLIIILFGLLACCNIGDIAGIDNVTVKVTNNYNTTIGINYFSLYGNSSVAIEDGKSVSLTVRSNSTLSVRADGRTIGTFSIGTNNRNLVID